MLLLKNESAANAEVIIARVVIFGVSQNTLVRSIIDPRRLPTKIFRLFRVRGQGKISHRAFFKTEIATFAASIEPINL
jgi:hypothetical protein